MLHRRRPAVFLSVFTAGLLAFTPPAGAGCLCDWLFGHHQTAVPVLPVAPAVPYAASYPVCPTPAVPYAASYPSCPTPAGAAVQPSYYGAPATADTAPLAAPALPAAVSTPAYSAQMPPYDVMSPNSVAPASYGAYYGSTTIPQTSLYGSAYPAATTSYAAAYPSAVSMPVTNVAPVFAAQPTGGLLGGVGRFFGSLFGTRYQTSYYQAPVTYYRPVTTVQPTTGAAVVTQQPCTSYQYQVQRSPYSSFQPGHGQAAAAQPAYGCVGTALPSADYAPTVPQPTLPPAGFDPYAVQSPPQVGSGYNGATSADACPPGTSTSYAPSNGYVPSNGYAPSNGYGTPAPLTGSPSDASRVEQPQLNGLPTTGASAPQPMWRQQPYSSSSSSSPRSTAPAPQRQAVPDVRPIPAPPGYEAPPLETQASPGDRTASQGNWDVKTVQWRTAASQSAPVNRAGLEMSAPQETRPQIAEPVVGEPRVQAAAPTRSAPRISEPLADASTAKDASNDWQLRGPANSQPRQPTVTPARKAPVYDNSGWKPVR